MKIYIVGGAVRDKLLGCPCKDVDYLVVGATPEQMIEQGFEQVGADFPVFLHPETKDEYALARIERKTGDGYHGFAVDFDPTVTVEDDLSRRDLTINAMAMDPETGEIIDPFGGQHDLEMKVLRHVSPAFAEDPLRVVRLARFAARYFGFTIANSTMQLAKEMVEAGELNHLPHERFWLEMEKALGEDMSGHFFWVLNEMGAFEHVNFFHDLFKFDHEKMTAAGFAVNRHRIRSSEERLMFFTALVASPGDKTVWTAPVRTQKLYTNLIRTRFTREATVETVFTALVATRAWSQGTDFSDLVRAMEMLEAYPECLALKDYQPACFVSEGKLFISSKRLWEIAEATREITAAQFPEVQGKALGEAIANARREVVAKALNVK